MKLPLNFRQVLEARLIPDSGASTLAASDVEAVASPYILGHKYGWEDSAAVHPMIFEITFKDSTEHVLGRPGSPGREGAMDNLQQHLIVR